MTAGTLPLATYHRTSQVGEGSFGSVVTVYNDDGDEFALKLFFKEDANENKEEDSLALEVGTLREISCLRFLRGATEAEQPPFIVRMVDVQTEWSDENDVGAGTSGCFGMAMPLFPCSLGQAIEQGKLRRHSSMTTNKRVKVQLAHDLLSALDFLHSNGILHRDVKTDNVLLQADENGWRAVLTDFSLAKAFAVSDCIDADDDDSVYEGHTGEVGTLIYAAPEVLEGDGHYGPGIDVWSLGVVLLEVLREETMPDHLKVKQIRPYLDDILNNLASHPPFPRLVRALLQTQCADRLSAREALDHELFEKFKLTYTSPRKLSVGEALPYDYDDELSGSKRKQRRKRLDRAHKYLGSKLSITLQASYEYSVQMDQLEDDLEDSQAPLDCAVLAHRFFEVELPDLDELEEEGQGLFSDWTKVGYVETEATLFMLLDFCLYPRHLGTNDT